jgi:hypothetical protein
LQVVGYKFWRDAETVKNFSPHLRKPEIKNGEEFSISVRKFLSKKLNPKREQQN